MEPARTLSEPDGRDPALQLPPLPLPRLNGVVGAGVLPHWLVGRARGTDLVWTSLAPLSITRGSAELDRLESIRPGPSLLLVALVPPGMLGDFALGAGDDVLSRLVLEPLRLALLSRDRLLGASRCCPARPCREQAVDPTAGRTALLVGTRASMDLPSCASTRSGFDGLGDLVCASFRTMGPSNERSVSPCLHLAAVAGSTSLAGCADTLPGREAGPAVR